jgi:VanZ family protein
MKYKYQKIIYAAGSILWTIFIWSNSMKSAAESGKASGAILKVINDNLTKISPYFQLTEHFIRKSAHFTEFAILGVLLSLTFLTISAPKIRCRYAFFAAFFAFIVASLDELLQLFSTGRSCQFTDVLLDFSGACAGIAFVFTVFLLVRRKHNKFSAGFKPEK